MPRLMIDDELRQEIFKYLDGLQASGTVSILGTAPYIVKGFALERREAWDILVEWIRTQRDRAQGE